MTEEFGWSSATNVGFSSALPLYQGLDAAGLTYDITYHRTDQWGELGISLGISSFSNTPPYQSIFIMYNGITSNVVSFLAQPTAPTLFFVYGCTGTVSEFSNWLSSYFASASNLGFVVSNSGFTVTSNSSLVAGVPSPYTPQFTSGYQSCLSVQDPQLILLMDVGTNPGYFGKTQNGTQIYMLPIGPFYDITTTGTDQIWMNAIVTDGKRKFVKSFIRIY